MTDLDDLSAIERADPGGFLECVEGSPGQVERGWELGKGVGSLPDPAGVSSVLVTGMGGSGISGDLMNAVLGSGFPHVAYTCKGYDLPGWVGEETLVLAVSYSGRTEETLQAFEKAFARGASLVTISAGGPLADLGESRRCPAVVLPPGLQPRAALGYMSMALLGICQRMGWTDLEADVVETVELLGKRIDEYGRRSPASGNPAKQLAARLVHRLPLVYGSEGLAEVAAYRWKCQFNECSKIASYNHFFPELDHNEISGWAGTDRLDCPTTVIVLRHRHEHPRVERRIEVTLPLIAERVTAVEEVHAGGDSPLANLMDLICLGDFAATYVALLSGVDPSKVELIDEVKRQLGTPPTSGEIVR
ncbi:MAG: bifunctional phosphoglucose/phosphomannose isomerase [Actinomycetota bacterium]|nr:bifunctional phosphoglucose/phosphomannose isomerase [Actinomycetota bacterium]